MTLISTYVSTLEAPKESKKIFYDNLSVPINAIHGKGNKSLLDMSMPEFVRSTTNCRKLPEIQFQARFRGLENRTDHNFGGTFDWFITKDT